MKNKPIILFVILIITSFSFFYSCDKIDEPFFKPVYTERTVLMELITSNTELNQDIYDSFISSISSSALIQPMLILSDDDGAGKTLVEDFLVQNGEALINRASENSKYGIEQSLWADKLNKELKKEGELILEVEGDYDQLSQVFKGNLSLTSTNGYSEPIYFSIYAIEDSVTINGIECMNVLQISEENIKLSTELKRQETISKTIDFDLSVFTTISNVKLLFVAYNNTTKEVLQVTSATLEGINFSKKQNILIEDFTGHQCGNCPLAHVELASLINTHGSQIIPMAIHWGYFAEVTPPDYPTDFTTEVGNAIASEFNLVFTPIGLVNRIGSSDKKIDFPAWDAAVLSLINNTPKVGIALTTNLNGNQLDISTYVKAYEQNDTLLKIQAFIIEDNIIDAQLWYGHDPQYIPDYEHSHVLRASVNGNWGEDLTPVPFRNNEIVNKKLSTTLQSEWNIENLDVVVIVYNSITKTILQVEKKHL